MYSMMIVTTRAPQTDIEISYRQITFDVIYWRPTGELTTISLHFHIDHTSSVITLHCTSKNATYSATEDPPDHTIIIEANIRASDKENPSALTTSGDTGFSLHAETTESRGVTVT